MPPRRDLVFVGVQFALLFGLMIDPLGLAVDVHDVVRVVGYGVCAATMIVGLLAVLQLGTNLTPWPSPRSGSRLVTTGLYALARHPIYACLLAFAFALALATGSVWRLGLALVLGGLFWRKATYEETLLRARYPAYAAYARRVGKFGPKWR